MLASAKSDANQATAQSFTTCARAWLKEREPRYSPTTVEVYTYWIGSLEEDPIGKKPVKNITEKDLAAWKKRQKMENSTLRNRCSWLNQVLKESGAAVRVEVPPKKDHKRRPLTPDERKTIVERFAKADPEIVLAAVLCWQCGLRRSEACGLMHEDVSGAGFWVKRSVLLAKGKLIVRPKLKTSKSHGWVPLPQELQATIGTGTGFVLGDGKNPMNPKSLTWHMSELIKGTVLEDIPYMGFHALRRTYGMTLLEIGADVVTAAQAMRHDPAMLLKEYARSRQDLMMDAVNKAFPSSGPGSLPGTKTAA